MAALSLLLSAGCSTQKNTAMSRFYHASLTRFNTYFNGRQAYIEGYESQEKAVKDNYLELIDVFPISDEDARNSGSGSYDIAIEKSQKCVTLHSIKKKPVRKNKSSMSEHEKKFYNKNEFNPFLWHAWMMMADSQRQKGEFLEAAGTYSYIGRLYQDEPEIVSEARMKMAQCYSELEWFYEADEVFSRMSYDSVPARQRGELAAIKASHFLKQRRYDDARQQLESAIPAQKMSKLQRIREYYLLGQLYNEAGYKQAAYKCFRRVIRMNPPYQTSFNARIQMTETMPVSDANKIEKKLRRMARDPNNKDYLDQVYYAMGNVHLACGDTVKALQTYEQGLKESEQRRPERGVLLLTMATLYWNRGEYADASRCYSEAVGLVEQDNPKYDELMLRSSVLSNLVQYTEQIELQDSLQHLATLPDSVVYGIVDKIIEDLIEEEKEAERLAKKQERDAEDAAEKTVESSAGDNDGSWYFYNPTLVRDGQRQFKRSWGSRKLEDNWRREDKSAVIPEFDDENDETEVSIPAAGDSLQLDSLSATARGAASSPQSDDPHTREYYIQQIPYTEEQRQESDDILAEALFRAGVVYKDELQEYELAEKSLTRSADGYPDREYADDALYNLYLLYSLWQRPDQADICRNRLGSQYPESEFTTIVMDPDFEENVRFGKHREDSLYQVAYSSYQNHDTETLRQCCRISAQKYPNGQNRARFLFLEATVQLQDGDLDGFLTTLKTIIENYPQSDISQLASVITQGIHDGRILQSTSFGSIWDRRNGIVSDSATVDSIRPEFSDDRYQPFIVVMAYPQDSLNENQLLFETARYNFTKYMVRNFDMTFRHEQGIGMFIISEFLNFDEAYLYRKRLYSDGDMASKLEGINTIVITRENLELLFKHYSFNDYTEFYNRHFLNIPEVDIEGQTIDEDPNTEYNSYDYE